MLAASRVSAKRDLKIAGNSGNIASSISVLLSVAAWPPEQQGDAPVKVNFVAAAFAAFMVLPLSVPSQAAQEPSHSRAHSTQKRQLGVAYRGLDGPTWDSNQPMSDADRMKGLCSTAPEFCPDYHGSNGG
jgi:hypothetical protein